MKHFRTLKEVCNELRISRRAIQGYEARNLIAPVSRNKYGHLLYDEEMLKRIAFIRFNQKIGFSIDDISNFIDGSYEETRKQFSKQADILRCEKAVLENRLNQIKRLEQLSSRDECLDAVLKIIKEENSK